MNDEKIALMTQLNEARDELWNALDGVDPTVEIYPGWKKREFLAHIAGWEAAVFDIFQDYRTNAPMKVYPYDNLTNVDAANAGFVAARQVLPLEVVKLECEFNRTAIKLLLMRIPDPLFNRLANFPWGQESFADWTKGAIRHERAHTADILQLTQAAAV